MYWKPGYKDTSYYCMDYFDNKVKWKANYTKDWFMDCLLPKIIEEDQMKFKDRSIFEKIYLKPINEQVRDFAQKKDTLNPIMLYNESDKTNIYSILERRCPL